MMRRRETSQQDKEDSERGSTAGERNETKNPQQTKSGGGTNIGRECKGVERSRGKLEL